MKRFLLIFLSILLAVAHTNATQIERGSSVAVMDMGVHQGTSDPDVNLLNAETASSEYIITRLVETKNFDVKDRTLILQALQKLNMLGLIDPDTAKRIGRILEVRYIIYGNVVDVSIAVEKTLVNVNTVKAHLVIRIMDIETGNVLMAAKGEGKSASAFIGDSEANFFFIGSTKVSQTAVHNALKKAAFQAVDVLDERLFGINKNKRK